MKLKTIAIAAFAFVAMAAMNGTSAFAQENGNRDENGKVVRGPYLTNKFGDNWFIGVAGGINLFGDGGYTPAVTPALDIDFGKWFTPAVGVRVGYQGLTGAEWSKTSSVLGAHPDFESGKYKQRFGFAYVHADALWNVSHAWGGYKETRFWNFVPYAHAGFLRTYQREGEEKYGDSEFAAGVGLLNVMRLCKRLDLTLDVRGLLMNGRHHEGQGGVSGAISATVGLSVNIGKINWTRASSVKNASANVDASKEAAAAIEAANKALEEAQKALAAKKEQLAKANEANKALQAENDALKNRAADVKEVVKYVEGLAGDAFYFDIAKTTLSDSELARLNEYVKNNEAELKKVEKISITGSADTKTGSIEFNKKIAANRVEYVKNLLVKKYGFSADKIAVRSSLVDSTNPALDRAVVISF